MSDRFAHHRERLAAIQGRAQEQLSKRRRELREALDDCVDEYGRANRIAFPRSLREELFDEQDGICNECGCQMDKDDNHIDHIIPIARGGGNERSNLQLLCPPCNWRIGSKVDPDELMDYIEEDRRNQ